MLPSWVRMDLGAMVIKEWLHTLQNYRTLELKSHHRLQFQVMPMTIVTKGTQIAVFCMQFVVDNVVY